MRKLLLSVFVGVAALALGASSAPAKERGQKAGKEITIQGQGQCAKCSLGETDSCQNAIVVEQGKKGKKKTYYLIQNDVSKAFHEKICQGPKKVQAVGTVKKVEGKLEFTASKIELAKE